jgi:hypothetical protein
MMPGEDEKKPQASVTGVPGSPTATMEEQNAIGMLRNDPQMRAYFINKIASPIANKMFDCGMIP